MQELDLNIDLDDISSLSNELELSESINSTLLETINESNNILTNLDYSGRYSILIQQPWIKELTYDNYCDLFLKYSDAIINLKLFSPKELVKAMSEL